MGEGGEGDKRKVINWRVDSLVSARSFKTILFRKKTSSVVVGVGREEGEGGVAGEEEASKKEKKSGWLELRLVS